MSTMSYDNIDIININNGEKISKKDLFLKCLIGESKSLHYLEKEDIINLSKCSKSTKDFVEEKNLLISNLLLHNET